MKVGVPVRIPEDLVLGCLARPEWPSRFWDTTPGLAPYYEILLRELWKFNLRKELTPVRRRDGTRCRQTASAADRAV